MPGVLDYPDVSVETKCYHCGDECGEPVFFDGKQFCCFGCKSVYEILSENKLCEYYHLDSNPGIKLTAPSDGRFAYLDRPDVEEQMVFFKEDNLNHVRFHIPQMHCVSCLWLLENLNRLNPGILSSKVDFDKKKLKLVYDSEKLGLRNIVELLSKIGYEPYITFNDIQIQNAQKPQNKLIFKLGVTGFCFANIMLLSFPEYLGLDITEDSDIVWVFRALIVGLSLPVFFYGATEFFKQTWLGIKNRYLNIDAPVSLAIFVTFTRSLYDIGTGSGPGFLDSMSGIVFFMLVGRYLQSRTKASLEFDRDYKSYFPVSVTKLLEQGETPILLSEIKENDRLKLRNQETVPVDGILLSETAELDYSFITGESTPRSIKRGELVYQGGRVLHSPVDMAAIKEFSRNSFVEMWNEGVMYRKREDHSIIHKLSNYFTISLFLIAGISALYWAIKDQDMILNVVTSILIVACPCSLLLASTFTNGFVMQLFAKYGFYLKNHLGIEILSSCQNIVFDKTGTLTLDSGMEVVYHGKELDQKIKSLIRSALESSSHPFSKAIAGYFRKFESLKLDDVREIPNSGIKARLGAMNIKIGSPKFVLPSIHITRSGHSEVHFSIDDNYYGFFELKQKVRPGVAEGISKLQNYGLHLLSGDNTGSVETLAKTLPQEMFILGECSPMDKLKYVESIQTKKSSVLMLGDGLNDAGALKQADFGISVMNENFTFSPASDALLEGNKLKFLPEFLRLSNYGQRTVQWIFAYSILYNLVGLSFAVSGYLSPLVAAVLMPASSLSIMLISYLSVLIFEKRNMIKIIDE